MPTVDFTIDDLKKAFATKDDLARFVTKDDLAGFATKDDIAGFATKDDLAGFATKTDMRELRELIEATEGRIVKTVKETFDEYDKKLSAQRRVIRKHSADIAELQVQRG